MLYMYLTVTKIFATDDILLTSNTDKKKLRGNKWSSLLPALDNNMMAIFNNACFIHGRTTIEDIVLYMVHVQFSLNVCLIPFYFYIWEILIIK